MLYKCICVNLLSTVYPTVEAPWGSWQILDETPLYKVKRVLIKPEQRLSYQSHEKREENWFIAAGEAEITLDGSIHKLKAGDYIHIPVKAKHRIQNATTNEVLIFIEIQRGSYFGEDDIERYADDYGRV